MDQFRFKWYHVAPTLHLCVCAVTAVLPENVGWEHLVWIDFPASALILAVVFSFDHPALVFGIFGTLWWYFLSRAVDIWIGRLLKYLRARSHHASP